ncbi:DUF3124 domain-containing protein [Candidatus Electrothrix sp.]|uniref:DUF3124 domain-containing protein n=1 Tax=Candidatus Electrothrix sp. TaxID=2170559 RepID=UPI004056C76B
MRLFSGTIIATLFITTLLFSCISQDEKPPQQTSTEEETVFIHDMTITTGQTLFVPAYSKVHYTGNNTMKLAVTLTIHNTDFTHPIFVTSVRYYNTTGKMVQEYREQPLRLGPMAATDFFVDSGEQTGGVGTHFIVEWVAEQPVYEPVVEALMVSNSGTQGLSFTSSGRVIKHIDIPPPF